MQTTNHIATRLAGALVAALLITAMPAAAAERSAPSRPAAPLAEGAGYDLTHGSDGVRVLQRQLRLAGQHPGPIDGRFGPLTEAAVAGFQRSQGLAVDGVAGRETQSALKRAAKLLAPGAGYGAPAGSSRVRTLQRRLRLAGERPGPIDGRFGPLTEAAVVRFQRREDLTVDGIVGNATMRSLKRELTRAKTVTPGRSSGRGRAAGRTRRTSQRVADSDQAASAFPRQIIAVAAGVALGLGAGLTLVRGWARLRGPRRRSRAVGRRRDALGLLAARALARRQAAEQAAPVLGYASVSAVGRGRRRDELHNQLQAIRSECERRGLRLVDVVRENEPNHGKGLDRPGLGYALRRIADGEARGLVVAELSRLSRSVADLGQVLEWFLHTRARLVAAAPGIDTGDRGGRLAARALIDVSGWERERLSERTRKGLEAARREGRSAGRPRVADNPALRERIARMRAEGMTLQAIADTLNAEGVPTIRGGVKWRPSSVQAAAGYRRPPRGRENGQEGWPGNGGDPGG